MEDNNINEEFSQELSDLKWQFESMQQIFGNLENTISQAKKSSDQEEKPEQKLEDNKDQNKDIFSNQLKKESNSKDSSAKENGSRQERPNRENSIKMSSGTLKLSDQIHDFMKETQTQQSNVQQEIQKSIQQAMDILNQANVQIQTNQALIMMNQFINQAEQQINHITENSRHSETGKNTQNYNEKQSQGQLS